MNRRGNRYLPRGLVSPESAAGGGVVVVVVVAGAAGDGDVLLVPAVVVVVPQVAGLALREGVLVAPTGLVPPAVSSVLS